MCLKNVRLSLLRRCAGRAARATLPVKTRYLSPAQPLTILRRLLL